MQDKKIQEKAREVALNIEQLMARVDFKYNRHQPCLVCKEQYRHHIDGLPCISDTERKTIVRVDRWGNIRPRTR
jgi:hypothetical protein|tara:strand:- start:2231 stop:2452 length:222 start_codon:yes stop_codon:yes gene_type:complete